MCLELINNYMYLFKRKENNCSEINTLLDCLLYFVL